MGYREVRILIDASSIEEAEEKALEVFSLEGTRVSNEEYFLAYGFEKENPENVRTLEGFETFDNQNFINLFNEQYQDFKKILSELHLKKFEDIEIKNFEHLRNKLADKYSDYLSPNITHKTLIYDGESYCPMLSNEKLHNFPMKYFVVTIIYKI